MSLRRPTVADLLFTFVIGPVCDVAQTSDCVISFKSLYVMSPRRPTVAFLLKPFMWCRLDARLWHAFYLFTLSRRRSRHPIGFQLFVLLTMSCRFLLFIFLTVRFLLFEWALLFCSWRIHACICYILCPNCLASTFLVLTWLVDLARCGRRRSHGWWVW